VPRHCINNNSIFIATRQQQHFHISKLYNIKNISSYKIKVNTILTTKSQEHNISNNNNNNRINITSARFFRPPTCQVFVAMTSISHLANFYWRESWSLALVSILSTFFVRFLYESVSCSFSLVTVWLCNFFCTKLLAHKMLVNVDEIYYSSQFYQPFTNSFCANNFGSAKITKLNCN
jgi:hypothetical protein